MTHLTLDEIIEYVSIDKLCEESLKLASKVDTHIRSCDECLEVVRALRSVHDSFENMKKSGDLKDFLQSEPIRDEMLLQRISEIREAEKSCNLESEMEY